MGLLEWCRARATGSAQNPPDLPPVPAPPLLDAPSLLGRLIDRLPKDHAARGIVSDIIHRVGVQDSFELDRICALPRRAADWRDTPDLTERWRKPTTCPGCPLCAYGPPALRPVQNAMLYEAGRENGMLGGVGVGWGKTLAGLLLPDALESKRAVLLLPPDLLPQFRRDHARYGRHFRVPTIIYAKEWDGYLYKAPRLFVVPYSMLSSVRYADILERLAPDLIIADEAHNLRHRTAARTKRFFRYLDKHPECRFCPMSGSLATISIKDYAHLAHFALKNRTPLPRNYRDLTEWAMALDPSEDPIPPGALLTRLGKGFDPHTESATAAARRAFRSRLVETPGVIFTDDHGAGMGLVIRKMDISVPADVREALHFVDTYWTTPDGADELTEATEVARVKKQLSQGFYYRWNWPGGIVDHEWMEARRNWHRVIRDILKKRAREGLDSPLLVAMAAKRDELRPEEIAAWQAWDSVRERPAPPTVPVWINDWLILEAVKWCKERTPEDPGIVWCEDVAVLDAIDVALDVDPAPVFRGGTEDNNRIASATPAEMPYIVCSRKANDTGKNLQAYCNNLVLRPSSNATNWEQMLGRTHRDGQRADEVKVSVCLHTPELLLAWEKANEVARFIQNTQGQRQRLVIAAKLF